MLEKHMRVVDTLLRIGERSGEVSVTISEEMPFVREDGMIDEVAYFEMMAQSIATLNAFRQLGQSESLFEGYLVGARSLEILGTARVGETLNVSVYKDARFGKFAIVKATVSRSDTVLARGEIKIWHDAASGGEDALDLETGGRTG
jgi:predicted hotdog family 3-hydroxylacyl-ACP dehydratase